MKTRYTVRFETMAVHAAADRDPRTGAVTASIQMSTTFERAPDGTFPSGFAYIRDANPNRKALETAMAALEGGASAVAFASGMAATMTVMQPLVFCLIENDSEMLHHAACLKLSFSARPNGGSWKRASVPGPHARGTFGARG
jgi:cystathionine beta-lyase/cystathionine gamma-synthase